MLRKRIIVLLGLAFLIVAANVYASQSFSPLLYDLIYYKKRDAVVAFLQKMQREKEFQTQYQYFKDIWGESLAKDVFKDATLMEQKAQALQGVLEKNPQSRDTLISLAFLYYDNRNFLKASEYYQKAKAVDPWVWISSLEKIALKVND